MFFSGIRQPCVALSAYSVYPVRRGISFLKNKRAGTESHHHRRRYWWADGQQPHSGAPASRPSSTNAADAFREVGAGLAIWSNAVRVLHHLGLEDTLKTIALPVQEAEICSSRGTVLIHLDLHRLAERLGVPNYLIHRHELLRALAGLLPGRGAADECRVHRRRARP